MPQNYSCPNCGSHEFITEPNQYDIFSFSENGFAIIATTQIDDYKLFCRVCSEEIDENKSIESISITLKT